MGRLKKLTSLLFSVSILISMMVTAPTALAADDAKWVEKAPMATAKREHASTVVNGKIYVSGGNVTDSAVPNVEIYDPQKNEWSAGAPMSTPRYSHVSEAIDGKVYLIGGWNKNGTVGATEIYDSKTNTWVTGAPYYVYAASSVVLNGKIYVIGGALQNSITNKVQIYNPATDTWVAGTSMPTSKRSHVSEVVNGKIYVIGGYTSTGQRLNTVEIYDPETNTWTTGAPVPEARSCAASVTIGNKIYVIGGLNEKGIYNSLYIYDTISDSWSIGPAMGSIRSYLCAALINNTIYAVGGEDGTKMLNKVEAIEISSVERKLAVLLNVGETGQLSVSYDLADNTSLTWSTSNQAVATVDANGKVTAAGVGTCDISAQNTDGTWKQSIPVRVLPGTANMYRLAVHLKPAQNAKLHLTDNPADTTWKSLDPAVATIDTAGKVTAVSQGLVIMEGTANGEAKQVYVRVKG